MPRRTGLRFEEEEVVLQERMGPKSAVRLTELYKELKEIGEKPDHDERDLETAELRLKIFEYERDNTGCLITERFGQDLSEDLEQREVEVNQENQIEANENDSQMHFVMVNMGELDRINKEGGHMLGDRALQLSAQDIEEVVRKNLQEVLGTEEINDYYELYRYAGNEFTVKITGVEESVAKKIAVGINKKENFPVPKEGVEAAPLVANTINMAQAVEIVNQVRANMEYQLIKNDKETKREIISVVKKMGEYRLEIAKIVMRGQRIKEKLAQGDKEAQGFFNEFMKKYFENTEFDNLDKFKELVASAEKGEVDFESEIRRVADELIREKNKIERENMNTERSIILDTINGIKEEDRLPKGYSSELLKDESKGKVWELQGTKGEKAIDAEQNKAKKIQDSIKAKDGKYDEKDVEVQNLKLELERSKRDGLTGLHKRREFFLQTRERIKKNKKGGVLFIDLGFLKYFDKEGGRNVGNQAIKTAAEILEQAIESSGIDAEAFRYGGDEFTINYKGSKTDVKKLMDEISRLKMDKVIPEREKSTVRYKPEQLVFNIGHFNDKNVQQMMNDLVEKGRLDPEVLKNKEQRARIMTELQVKAADMLIAMEKATTRFSFLVEKIRAEAENTDTLIKFSEKSIFGASDKLKELAESKLDGVELDKEIEKFVKENTLTKIEGEVDRDQLVDLIVEHYAHEQWFQEKIEKLEGEVGKLKTELGAEHETVSRLQETISQLESEKAQIVKIRKGLVSGEMEK